MSAISASTARPFITAEYSRFTVKSIPLCTNAFFTALRFCSSFCSILLASFDARKSGTFEYVLIFSPYERSGVSSSSTIMRTFPLSPLLLISFDGTAKISFVSANTPEPEIKRHTETKAAAMRFKNLLFIFYFANPFVNKLALFTVSDD